MTRVGHLAVWLLLFSSGIAHADPEQIATRYLDAIVYRDLTALADLADPSSPAPSAQLGALPILADAFEIISIDTRAGASTVRFRLGGVHAASGQPMTLPGTLTVLSEDPPRVAFAPPALASPTAPAPTSSAGTAPGLPPSQTIRGITATDVLAHLDEAHRDLESLRMGLNMGGSLGGQALGLNGTFLYGAPNRVRLDLGEALFVHDGFTSTLYLPAANAYMNVPLPVGGDLLGLTAGTDPSRVSLLGEDEIDGVPVWWLAVAPSAPGGSGLGGVSGPIEVWVEQESGLPRRVSTRVMGSAATLNFHSAEVNPPDLTPQDFQFVPPPGAMLLSSGLGGLGL